GRGIMPARCGLAARCCPRQGWSCFTSRFLREDVMQSVSCRRAGAVNRNSARPHRFRPQFESLESRITPYVLSGYQWANANVSVSLMPDGTVIQPDHASNLFATYNAAYSPATWQYQVARALQVWANVSNLNFHFVTDDGSPQGTTGLSQGDSRFGDIRIGGYNMGSGIPGIGWDPRSTTPGGDGQLNNTYPPPLRRHPHPPPR